MKNAYKSIAFIFCLCFVTSVNAELICSLGASLGQQYNPGFDQRPTSRAALEIQRIYGALCPNGCGDYVLRRNATAPNAMAQATGPGQSKLVYNPNFMAQIENDYGSGATFGILAHEFGHHIDFHTTPAWMNNSWSRELKADAWAGCALAKVGGGTQQIENSLRAIAAYPSPSHPGWQQRHQAVRTGFTNCGGNWSSSYNLSQRQPRISQPPPARFCQTNRGQCRLAQSMSVGANCTCPLYNAFGRLLSLDRGTATR